MLYEGIGGDNLSITNVTIDGDIGVGGTGKVHYSGPGTINGQLDFAAPNTGQFQDTNGNNVGPSTVNYNQSAVTTALNEINLLSKTLGAEASTPIAIHGSMTINASDGTLDGGGNRIFNVTSYKEDNGNVVTINGDAAGDSVVFNFNFSSNVNFGGVVILNGLSADQVLWNVSGTGKNVQLNNNAPSLPLGAAFKGIILAPNDTLSVVTANFDGRAWGGGNTDMHIVGNTTIKSVHTGAGMGSGRDDASAMPQSSSISPAVTAAAAPSNPAPASLATGTLAKDLKSVIVAPVITPASAIATPPIPALSTVAPANTAVTPAAATPNLYVTFASSGGVKSIAFALSYDPELVIVTGAEPGPDLPVTAQLAFAIDQNGETARARIVIVSDDALPSGDINLASLRLASAVEGDSSAALLGTTVEEINGAVSSCSHTKTMLKLRIPYGGSTEITESQTSQGPAGDWQMNFSNDAPDQNPNAKIRLAIPPEKATDAAITDDEDVSCTADRIDDGETLRVLRARAPVPAWARRAVGEGVKSCPRAGCGKSSCPVR